MQRLGPVIDEISPLRVASKNSLMSSIAGLAHGSSLQHVRRLEDQDRDRPCFVEVASCGRCIEFLEEASSIKE
jgi:hypothetical protein